VREAWREEGGEGGIENLSITLQERREGGREGGREEGRKGGHTLSLVKASLSSGSSTSPVSSSGSNAC